MLTVAALKRSIQSASSEKRALKAAISKLEGRCCRWAGRETRVARGADKGKDLLLRPLIDKLYDLQEFLSREVDRIYGKGTKMGASLRDRISDVKTPLTWAPKKKPSEEAPRFAPGAAARVLNRVLNFDDPGL